MTHAEKAKQNFLDGYNCTQSVVLAFCDVTHMDEEYAKKVSGAFGGGFSRLREMCGAVSGMAFVLSSLYGYTDPKDKTTKDNLYKMVQDVANRFKERNKSYTCRDLLGLAEKTSNYVSAERTQEYYSKRPCPDLCYSAAEILDEYLNELNNSKQ